MGRKLMGDNEISLKILKNPIRFKPTFTKNQHLSKSEFTMVKTKSLFENSSKSMANI